MTTIFEDLRDRFHEIHTDLLNSFKDLPQEAVDWVAGPEMNSIAVLVTHLTGAECYLIGVALDEPPIRDREAEFSVHGLSPDNLRTRLAEADEYIQKALMRFAVDDLPRVHISPRNQKQVTASWCILHALEHTAIHAGHIQITRQLWEQKKG